MTDLQEGLIVGRGKKESQHYKKRFEQCQTKVRALKNKNNEVQKLCDNELESDIRSAIRSQTAFIDNEIGELKKSLELLSRDYTDPGSKKKIKQLCALASREMQRNKRIMQDFVNRASASVSMFKTDAEHHKNRSQPINEGTEPVKHKSSRVDENEGESSFSQYMINDLKAEQKMQAERTALLKQLQEKNLKINAIMIDIGQMVGGEQRDMIDQIDNNLHEVKYNVGTANEELEQAIVYQKKSKKKYICVISTIVVLLLIAGGLIYFLVVN